MEKIHMEVANILHMNTGNGESSYAQNSFLQETVIRKGMSILKHTIKGMANIDIVFRDNFKIADLGCSSGTNTLLVASTIIDIVDEVCKENNRKAPQFQVFLNDLYSNDFNAIFKMLPTFLAKLKEEKGENLGPTFVSAVPGSFYERLFPDQTLHLVHSSYGLHWLSQVPEGLDNNKDNIYIGKTSPRNVSEMYRKQFYADFTKFLRLRSKEIVFDGSMVLTFHGRSTIDPTSDDCCCLNELLARSLLDMAKKGLVRESDINAFNLPYYTPSKDEVRNVIHNEGSFSLDSVYVFQVNWDPWDTDYTNTNCCKEHSHIHGKNTTKIYRAVHEPLLTSCFGNSIMDALFKTFEKHVAEHLANKKTRHFNILISLTKR